MKTNKLIALALLVATSIILTRFLSFYVPFFGANTIRAGLGHVPILLTGILFGPLAGAMVGAVSDVIGTLLFNPLPYFPGFTLSAALTGVIAGLMIKLLEKYHHIGIVQMLGLVYVAELPTSVFMNTYFVSIISGIPYSYLLLPRVAATAIFVIAYSIILLVLYKKLIKLDFLKKMR
jgi:ECF transporter S component (folate family)